jgi:tetratricopeptide (TPR) repeat protein
MKRIKMSEISLSLFVLFALAPRNSAQDCQSEATAVTNCPDSAADTAEPPTKTVGDNPLLRGLNLSPIRGEDCGERLVRLGRYREAVEAYRKMIALKPDDAVLHNNLCVAYCLLGHYENGISACAEALRMEPQLADAYNNLAMAFSLLGNYRKAVEAYRQAIRINPQLAQAHNNLGVAYNRLGRHGKAIRAFKQSVRLKPDFAEAHYNLAFSYLAIGDNKSALAEYELLKSLDRGLAELVFEAISNSYKFKVQPEKRGDNRRVLARSR